MVTGKDMHLQLWIVKMMQNEESIEVLLIVHI